MLKRYIKISLLAFFILAVAGSVVFVFKNETRMVRIENQNVEIADKADNADKADSIPSTRDSSQTNSGQASEKDGTEGLIIANKTDKANTTDVTDKINIESRLVGFGFQKASGRKIDTVIIHSSYDALGNDPYDVSGLITEYKEYGVAPHYLIDRKGNIYRLVEEKNIAYHAGEGKTPDGRSGVNSFSIGIELMNTKTDSYTDEQYASLKNLLANLKKGYKIKYVLGHKDIAPGRKDDPWNFNFDKLK